MPIKQCSPGLAKGLNRPYITGVNRLAGEKQDGFRM